MQTERFTLDQGAPRGLTLVEFLVAAGLLIFGSTALLMGLQYAMAHADHIRDIQIALNAAQGQLERLTGEGFDTLWTDAQYADARTQAQYVTAEQLPAAVSRLSNPVIAFQIRNATGAVPPQYLDVHIAVCWDTRGRRYGEGTACNDTTADVDVWVSSPAMMSTRLANPDHAS